MNIDSCRMLSFILINVFVCDQLVVFISQPDHTWGPNLTPVNLHCSLLYRTYLIDITFHSQPVLKSFVLTFQITHDQDCVTMDLYCLQMFFVSFFLGICLTFRYVLQLHFISLISQIISSNITTTITPFQLKFFFG